MLIIKRLLLSVAVHPVLVSLLQPLCPRQFRLLLLLIIFLLIDIVILLLVLIVVVVDILILVLVCLRQEAGVSIRDYPSRCTSSQG